MGHLLQETEQEVSGVGVVGEESVDGFVQDVSVEPAAGGRQRSEGSQHEARLLPRHRLLYLLHMLPGIWRTRNTAERGTFRCGVYSPQPTCRAPV